MIVEQSRAALAAIHPVLPAAALVLLIWLPQWAIRRWAPKLWELPASFGPRGKELRQAYQALPSIVAGALLTALSSNGDPWQAVTGAALGALAPFWHHLLKASPLPYQGELGGRDGDDSDDDDDIPRRPNAPLGLSVLAVVVCACTPTAKAPDPASKLAAAQAECAAYDALPSAVKTPDQDRACFVVRRVCIESLQPAIVAPPSSYGAKIVDGGAWVEL